MSFALRNSLILAVLLALVIIGFTLMNSKSVKRLKEIEASYNMNNQQLENLKRENPDLKDKEEIIRSLAELREKVKEESKIISRENTPTLTFQYLLDICDRFCPDLTFDFQLTRSGVVDDVKFNSYTVNGKAPVQSVYTFIYQIENQILLYTIESIKLEEELVEGISTKNVIFTIVLNAYFSSEAQTFKDAYLRNLPQKNINYDPLFSRIHAPIPDEEQDKKLDTHTCTLIGLTPEKAFLKDAQGKIHILEQGDKVAYGYLHTINWEEQSILFKINEIGITQDQKVIMNEKDE